MRMVSPASTDLKKAFKKLFKGLSKAVKRTLKYLLKDLLRLPKASLQTDWSALSLDPLSL